MLQLILDTERLLLRGFLREEHRQEVVNQIRCCNPCDFGCGSGEILPRLRNNTDNTHHGRMPVRLLQYRHHYDVS